MGLRQANRTAAKSASNGSGSSSGSSVAAKVATWFKKGYGATPLSREKAQLVQAYYGLRELLGLKFQSELGLRKSKKRFDWTQWNSKTFAVIAGDPLKPKLTPEQMAELAIAYLPEITGDSVDAVMAQLAIFNQQSQTKRNETRLLANTLSSSTASEDAFEDDEFDAEGDDDDDVDEEEDDDFDEEEDE